jgi:hypothetical protein
MILRGGGEERREEIGRVGRPSPHCPGPAEDYEAPLDQGCALTAPERSRLLESCSCEPQSLISTQGATKNATKPRAPVRSTH